jgi:hypothetical protein
VAARPWRNADVVGDDSWHHTLTVEERNEIVVVTRRVMADTTHGATGDSLTRESFPLPLLAPRIAEWNAALSEGPGFLLVHGFPVELLDGAGIEVAYMGLGSHLGTRVGQNRHGDLITHIRDDRVPQTGEIKRLYRTRDRQDFHTDAADIIGLLCLHTARAGGESKIVSSRAVYDEMMRVRPDLVDELRTTLYWDRQDDHAPGEQPWFALPPVFDLNGEPRVFYVGWYIRNAQRHADVPRLTARQLEAMELLESIANDPAFHLQMDFVPGDIQFLNNGAILHAREAYEDHENPDKRRHLLRLWLAAHSFVSVDDGLRTGIGQNR